MTDAERERLTIERNESLRDQLQQSFTHVEIIQGDPNTSLLSYRNEEAELYGIFKYYEGEWHTMSVYDRHHTPEEMQSAINEFTRHRTQFVPFYSIPELDKIKRLFAGCKVDIEFISDDEGGENGIVYLNNYDGDYLIYGDRIE